MNLSLEFKKIKRTGLIPAFAGGGLLAASIPILNMAVRAERYTGLAASPVQILLDANWSMMSMLNCLLIIVGAALLYHAEYENNALQKMCSLPARESSLFFGKFLLMTILCTMTLTLEALSIAFCTVHWFDPSAGLSAELCAGVETGIKTGAGIGIEILQNFGYELLLLLPAAALSLLLASACKNMWGVLGIGVICIFVSTILPIGHFVPSLFPFAMPYGFLSGTGTNFARALAIAALLELFTLSLGEIILIRIRRSLT